MYFLVQRGSNDREDIGRHEKDKREVTQGTNMGGGGGRGDGGVEFFVLCF
jgi:hypothetical protein